MKLSRVCLFVSFLNESDDTQSFEDLTRLYAHTGVAGRGDLTPFISLGLFTRETLWVGLGEGKEEEGKHGDVCAVNSKLGGSTEFHIPK